MNKEAEIKAGREIYKAFSETLAQSHNIAAALELCNFESYVWGEDETHNGAATTYNINLVGEDVTINVMVDAYHDNGKMHLDEYFELVSRKSDDWDGLYYGLN